MLSRGKVGPSIVVATMLAVRSGVAEGANTTLGCFSDKAEYQYSLSPGMPGTVLYWSIDKNAEELRVLLVNTNGEGWVAMGTSPQGTMIDSEVVLGLPDEGTVLKYHVSAYSPKGIVAMSAPQQTLAGTSITFENGKTEMMFSKKIEEQGEHPILAAGLNPLIFAIGSTSTLQHHVEKASVAIDFSTCLIYGTTTFSYLTSKYLFFIDGDNRFDTIQTFCALSFLDSTTAPIKKESVVTHASLMISAWMFLALFGISAAACKVLIRSPGWIWAHIAFQLAAVAAMAGGVAVIVAAVNDSGGEHMKSHSTSFGVHTILGVEALSIAGFQVMLSNDKHTHKDCIYRTFLLVL